MRSAELRCVNLLLCFTFRSVHSASGRMRMAQRHRYCTQTPLVCHQISRIASRNDAPFCTNCALFSAVFYYLSPGFHTHADAVRHKSASSRRARRTAHLRPSQYPDSAAWRGEHRSSDPPIHRSTDPPTHRPTDPPIHRWRVTRSSVTHCEASGATNAPEPMYGQCKRSAYYTGRISLQGDKSELDARGKFMQPGLCARAGWHGVHHTGLDPEPRAPYIRA
jgi:hypothetical protein